MSRFNVTPIAEDDANHILHNRLGRPATDADRLAFARLALYNLPPHTVQQQMRSAAYPTPEERCALAEKARGTPYDIFMDVVEEVIGLTTTTAA